MGTTGPASSDVEWRRWSYGQAVWEQKWKVGWMPGNRALTAEWAGVGWAMRSPQTLVNLRVSRPLKEAGGESRNERGGSLGFRNHRTCQACEESQGEEWRGADRLMTRGGRDGLVPVPLTGKRRRDMGN